MYIELSIPAGEYNEDLIYSILYQNGVKSILEDYGLIKVYFKTSEKKRLNSLLKTLKNKVNIPDSEITVSRLEDIDWNKDWKKSLEPVYIENKIIIHPSWKKPKLKKDDKRILIEIDPKMSYGTGHNETTQLILEIMCEYLTDDDKYILDYGCGTAILAIGAVKLGAKKVIAIDIDKDSIINAKEYIKNNKVNRKVKLYLSELKDIKEKGFDSILCNINKNIIIRNIKTLRSKLKLNGKLFITGILHSEEKEIKRALKKYKFTLVEMRSKEEWLAFYALKT